MSSGYGGHGSTTCSVVPFSPVNISHPKRQCCFDAACFESPRFGSAQKLSCSFCSCLNLYFQCRYSQHRTFIADWRVAAWAHAEIAEISRNSNTSCDCQCSSAPYDSSHCRVWSAAARQSLSLYSTYASSTVRDYLALPYGLSLSSSSS